MYSLVIVVLCCLFVSCVAMPVYVRKDITDDSTASTITSTTDTTSTKQNIMKNCPSQMIWDIPSQNCVPYCPTCDQTPKKAPLVLVDNVTPLIYIGGIAAGIVFLMICRACNCCGFLNICIKLRRKIVIPPIPIIPQDSTNVFVDYESDTSSINESDTISFDLPVEECVISEPYLPEYTDLGEAPEINNNSQSPPSYVEPPPSYVEPPPYDQIVPGTSESNV
uniref:Uncharacterized protein n=1 Tax=viral metagenome TaxID=1070528 RepID=A0A6C0EYD5_9ZZZZ